MEAADSLAKFVEAEDNLAKFVEAEDSLAKWAEVGEQVAVRGTGPARNVQMSTGAGGFSATSAIDIKVFVREAMLTMEPQ